MRLVNECDILITSKDRATEIFGLMQALRTQTFQCWNLYILDNAYGTPLQSFYFIQTMIARLQLEGHKVKIIRNDIDLGVCFARNLLNKIQMTEGTGDYSLRIDDDVLPEPDYLEKLIKVIEAGYDIASGIIPLLGQPEFTREDKVLNGEINKIKLDNEGNILEFGDDCGYSYIEEEILPAGHFRSSALYPSKINSEIRYEDNLSNYGFREESFFSLRCRMKGYKIGVHTKAIQLHLATPSGGGRQTMTQELVAQDDQTFKLWIQERYLAGELEFLK